MRRRQAAILAILLSMVLLGSATLMVLSGNHNCNRVICACQESDCSHNQCPVCQAVRACEAMMSAMVMVAVVRGRMALSAGWQRRSPIKKRCLVQTPVDLRTRLLC